MGSRPASAFLFSHVDVGDAFTIINHIWGLIPARVCLFPFSAACRAMHKETITVPTTKSTTTSTTAMPTEQRLATVGLTPVKKSAPATTTPTTPVIVSAPVAAASEVVQKRHGKSQSQRQLLPQSRRCLQLLVWALPIKRNMVDPRKSPSNVNVHVSSTLGKASR